MLLMLVGGVVADASDLRKLLASLQCVAALPPLALGCALLVYGPTFPALIAYALVSLYAYQVDKEMEQLAEELGVDLDAE